MFDKDFEMNGGLMDFAVIMYHNAKEILEKSPSYQTRNGPFFYLSKLENAQEAQVWNQIFIWAQDKLELPQGKVYELIHYDF